MSDKIKQSRKPQRRTPDQVKFILGLIDQYPLAFAFSKEHYDARRKWYTAGGTLLKAPEARKQRDQVCEACRDAGYGLFQTMSMTGFPESTVERSFKGKARTEAKCKTIT
jgi:hypothetical protein